MQKFYVGTSGYSYKNWGKSFYPAGLKSAEWLGYFAQHFNSVELNNTFYHLARPSSFEKWFAETPENFTFVVKGSRFISHIKRLDVGPDSIEKVFGPASLLKHKLGAVLWQLPASSHANLERLQKFCELLRSHPLSKDVRQTIEFRHASWYCDEVYEILRRHNVALCFADSNRWPSDWTVTADFIYMRFHGSPRLYYSEYGKSLNDWSKKLRELADGRDIYAYFNNDAGGFAVTDALKLRELFD